jgi:Ca-activated chloride channel family protein
VGIVVYGTDARVVLPHTGIENREFILKAINKLHPGGSTNAEAGLRMGYKLALKNSKSDSINRVILCSDGVANVGQTGPDAILKEIRTYLKEGVTLTTVGFGMGNYNDILMERLANKGNGSYAYVDTLKEAKRVFVENLTGTLQVIAKDAKIQVEFNRKTVSHFRLLGYENRSLAHEDFRKDDVDAGEIGSGHSVTALYEIKLHENADGKLATVFIRHEDPETQNVTEVNETISTNQLKGTFEETSSEFQLVASVAEFAEILRNSFWAKEGSLTTVQQTIDGVLPHLHSKTPQDKQRKEELLNLVREVRRLKEQKEG